MSTARDIGPVPIAFADIQVGDEIRVVTTWMGEATVASIDSDLIITTSGDHLFSDTFGGSREVFLLKRTEPAPGTLWIDRNGSVWVKTGPTDDWSYVWTGIGPRPIVGRGTNHLVNVRPWNVGDSI